MPLSESVSNADMERVASERVVPALLAQGFCWLDGVLGDVTGGAVLEQVRRMHQQGALRGGRLMRSAPGLSHKEVRGDRIAWITGAERGCEPVTVLLTTIDKLVMATARRLDKSISHRSKAMVACYPGNGAGYVKHVDNPNSDGRCLTCIYYLNKDWSATEDGGVLRIFPEGNRTSWTSSRCSIVYFCSGPTDVTRMKYCPRTVPGLRSQCGISTQRNVLKLRGAAENAPGQKTSKAKSERSTSGALSPRPTGGRCRP
uniref:Egl-9 family hypoxia-inducible factor 3 n=1 Tax=Neogobius melanostomus TaxID=47308 RepID=A0A8C6SM56_9GOBI